MVSFASPAWSPLPVLPVFASALDIRILSSFIAATKQQDYLISSHRVVDPVTLSDIDAEFPYPIAAEFVISEIFQLDPIDSPVNGNSCLRIAQLTVPLQVDVFLRPG
jgi:hypothetical protein